MQISKWTMCSGEFTGSLFNLALLTHMVIIGSKLVVVIIRGSTLVYTKMSFLQQRKMYIILKHDIFKGANFHTTDESQAVSLSLWYIGSFGSLQPCMYRTRGHCQLNGLGDLGYCSRFLFRKCCRVCFNSFICTSAKSTGAVPESITPAPGINLKLECF